MTTVRGWWRPVVAAVLLAAVVVGCTRTVDGSGSAPPRASALARAASVTMTGLPHGFAIHTSISVEDRSATSDFRFQVDDAEGTLLLMGQRCELRRVDGRDYARAGAGFWDEAGVGAAAAAAVGGRWAQLPDGDTVGAQLDRDNYLHGFEHASDSAFDGHTRSGQLDGARVWQVQDARTHEVVSITTDGAPRVLRAENSASRTDYTEPTDDLRVSAPADPVPFPD